MSDIATKLANKGYIKESEVQALIDRDPTMIETIYDKLERMQDHIRRHRNASSPQIRKIADSIDEYKEALLELLT